LSHYAEDSASYRPDAELSDMIGLLNFLKIDRVAVIGTSRGGIVGMLMTALHRARLAGLFLNDIGPELEPAGLLRIRTYLGVQTQFESWDAAVTGLKSNNPGFQSLTADEWRAFALRVYKQADGVPCTDYDMALADTFPAIDDIKAGRCKPVGPFW
jgi:pimeloyl-ACP methyl ester carboxylesterase